MPWPFKRKNLQVFDLNVDPNTANVFPGSSTLSIINVKPYSSEQMKVKLVAMAASVGDKISEGIKIAFNPQSGVAPFGSTMSIQTSTALGPGKHSFLVVGTSRDVKQTANYTLTVQGQEPAAPASA